MIKGATDRLSVKLALVLVYSISAVCVGRAKSRRNGDFGWGVPMLGVAPPPPLPRAVSKVFSLHVVFFFTSVPSVLPFFVW